MPFLKIHQTAGILPFTANIAQLVELLICNQPVGGSSPSVGSDMAVSYAAALAGNPVCEA